MQRPGVDKAGLETIRRLLIEEGHGMDLAAAVRHIDRMIDAADGDTKVNAPECLGGQQPPSSP